MVKLPVIVYKRNSRESVIADAIQLRGKLEQKALEEEAVTGNYIRPIVLFRHSQGATMITLPLIK